MSPVLPTFHESWYRVADLKLRIRSSVHIVRQRYRGQRRYVVLDQANNAAFSLPQPGYQLLGLLDGTRTLREAWESCCKVLGDEAPTQGEALDLLGQLASNNLLESELPPDAAGMFERYKKRKKRELQNALMNVLFPRIPIFDPDAILEKGIFLVGWIFSWPSALPCSEPRWPMEAWFEFRRPDRAVGARDESGHRRRRCDRADRRGPGRICARSGRCLVVGRHRSGQPGGGL